MKKALVLATAMLFVASTAMAQITGSAHDFSADGWSGGEICVVCHTPHNADLTVAEAPLWDHEVTTASFTVYSSSTLDAGPLAQPDGSSKLCLSCHDGTVAIDSYGGATGTNFATGDALVGISLADDHPVSFTYDATLATADGGLYDPSSANSGLGGTIAADLLAAGKMQCSSCHGVHNEYGVAKLLVKSNAGSALCMTCHDK